MAGAVYTCPRSIGVLVAGLDHREPRGAGQVPGEGTVVARMQVLDHEDRQREILGKRREDDAEGLDAARGTADDDGLVMRAARCVSCFACSHGAPFFL